jgi:Protein of unknown function (DUF3641)/Radical SAM superfamily
LKTMITLIATDAFIVPFDRSVPIRRCSSCSSSCSSSSSSSCSSSSITSRRSYTTLSSTCNDNNDDDNNEIATSSTSFGSTTTTATKTATATATPTTAATSAAFLPDYGTTPIDIDQIRLPTITELKKKRDVWRRTELFGNSLIEQTMLDIDAAAVDTSTTTTAVGTSTTATTRTTKEERTAQRRSLKQAGVPNFEQHVLANAISVILEKEVEAMTTTTTTVTTTFASTTTTTDTNPPTTTTNNAQEQQQHRRQLLLHRTTVPTILQINIGLYCNQACQHCHVESSPLRTSEMMNLDVILQCLTLLKNTPTITTLDITGGAPELHEHFRFLISMARSLRPTREELDIIDRCNLTVLQEPNQGQDLINFLKQHDVHVIASLPCYSERNVKEQRGDQVFERSIAALIALNEAGYGSGTSTSVDTSSSTNDIDHTNGNENTGNDNKSDDMSAPTKQQPQPQYKLDLVYNPAGAFLPPPQDTLQVQYKEQLYNNFGITFDELYTITNMPIQRFADYLHRRNELIDYMNLLVRNYNPATIANVMCHNTISIRYDGVLYDCDFNQQLDLPILMEEQYDCDNDDTFTKNIEYEDTKTDDRYTTTAATTTTTRHRRLRPMTVFDIQSLDDIMQLQQKSSTTTKIRTDAHCFGCTAGMGSSCQGTTAI